MNRLRTGLQFICCPSCNHKWVEDVEVHGASLCLPYNEAKECPECSEPFTADDFAGDMRRAS